MSASMEQFTPGTFGYVVGQVGLSWSELQRLSGIQHSTMLRWAEANQRGRPVAMRSSRPQIEKVFTAINNMAREQGLQTCYQPQHFGLLWPQTGSNAPLETLTAVEQRARTLQEALLTASSDREQWEILKEYGAAAKTETLRAAWHSVWKRYCSSSFPHTFDAVYNHPPKEVYWWPR